MSPTNRLYPSAFSNPLHPSAFALLPARSLDALDSDMAEVRAASILHGLGFTKEMQVGLHNWGCVGGWWAGG